VLSRRAERLPVPPPAARTTGSSSIAPIAASGAMPRKTHRQPTVAVTAPANAGPTSDGTTQAPDIAAKTRGRLSSGKTRATST